MLRSYVSPEVVAHIMSDGRTSLASGVRLPVTVLFADIRGFTRVANVGSPARMDYTVVGAVVNLAARLVAAAGPGVILVSGPVRDRVVAEGGCGVRFGRARRLQLKGFRAPVVAYPAQPPQQSPRAKSGVRTTVDPVCGMKLELRRALVASHRGRRFYFCSDTCRREFKRHPELGGRGPSSGSGRSVTPS